MRSQFTADIAACAMSEHEAEGIDNSHQANTTPVAPLTLVPSWLTKKVSAILYTLVTSILTVVGSPSCSTSLLTGVLSFYHIVSAHYLFS